MNKELVKHNCPHCECDVPPITQEEFVRQLKDISGVSELLKGKVETKEGPRLVEQYKAHEEYQLEQLKHIGNAIKKTWDID